MKTETLISKIKEKGFVFPTVLRWTADDFDTRMEAVGQGHQCKTISNEDKLMILEEFFEEYEDEICEFINQKLEDHLDSMADYQPKDEMF